MFKKILLTLFLTSIASTYVYADGCTNPRTSYDQTYCLAKLFVESDNELNAVYNNLTAMIDSGVKKQLIQAQRDWIKFRNESCATDGIINVDCNFKVNQTRLAFLQDRLRECKVGHCQTQLIIKQEFDTEL